MKTSIYTHVTSKIDRPIFDVYSGKCRWLFCLAQWSEAKIGLLQNSNRYYTLLLFICIPAFINSCGQNAVKEKKIADTDTIVVNHSNNTIHKSTSKKNLTKNPGLKTPFPKNFDQEAYLIDTILVFQEHKLLITRKKMMNEHKKIIEDDTPLIIHIVKTANDSVIHTKEFEENIFDNLISFNNSGNTTHYLSLLIFGGGSGHIVHIYKVTLDKEPHFIKVCQYTELAWHSFSKDGSELLILQGIWDLNEDETHFTEHRYEILRYDLSHEQPKEINESFTRNKYPCLGEGVSSGKELILLMKDKEPGIFKTINLDNYSLE